MEKATLWGQYFSGLGANGKPKRAMRGLVTAIIEDNTNVDAFHLNSDAAYAGC